MRSLSLDGKYAIVTGGARGLGANMARGLAEAGVKGIYLFDYREAMSIASAEKIRTATGIDCRFVRVDVRDATSVTEAVDEVYDAFGKVDIVINAAGIADSNIPAEDYPDEKFRNLININLTGTFLVCREIARRMIALSHKGSIINIASMSAHIVNFPQQQCCYNASKAAVVQLTRSLAAEWARHGIRVNAVSPGYMDTELNRRPELEEKKRVWCERTPMARLGDVAELNALVVFLASDGSSFMTGSNVAIDGGYTLW